MLAEKNHRLAALLEFIENNINLKHLEYVERLHAAANRFEKVPLLPLTIIPAVDFFNYSEGSNLYPYREAFEDPARMMYNELVQTCFGASTYSSVQLRDFFPLQIRSNHGIGIIASMFGVRSKVLFDNMPFVEHLESREELKKIIRRGVPDYNAGLGERVKETYHFFQQALRDFPASARGIKITQPDLQGPFDIAHLLLGTDIFYLVYDEPRLLHELLELITATYIGYRHFIDRYYPLNDRLNAADRGEHKASPVLNKSAPGDRGTANDRAEDKGKGSGKPAGMVYVHGDINYGRVVIKDDTAQVNLSPGMYEEFAWQYNQKIFREFEGSYHSCGRVNDHVYQLLNGEESVGGINYGNPDLHDAGEILKNNQDKRRVILTWGWNQGFTALKKILEEDLSTGITLACRVKDLEEGRGVLDYYLENCLKKQTWRKEGKENFNLDEPGQKH